MKKIKTTIKIVTIGFAIISFPSCGNQESNAEEAQIETHDQKGEHNAVDAYTCSMHPEISGKVGEKCTICGMDLVPVSGGDH